MRLNLALITACVVLVGQQTEGPAAPVPQVVTSPGNPGTPASPEMDAQVRAAISELPVALTRGAEAARPLFSAAGEPSLTTLLTFFQSGERPLSEVTPWRFSVRTTRVLSPGYVMVEADLVQFGSQIVANRVPFFLLMTKGSERWLVDVARILTR